MLRNMEKKRRVIHCDRKTAPDLAGATLQEALSESLKLRPTIEDTRMDLQDGVAEIRHRRHSADGLYLDIAKWTPRESVSTVPHPVPPPSDADLASEPPGSTWDYLDGAGMVLISGDHCLVMPSGLPHPTIIRYLSGLLDISLQVTPLTDSDTATALHEQGVKRIRLNLGQYAETSRELEHRRPRTIVQRLTSDMWEALITNEATRQEIAEAANVSARLMISIDGRRRGLTHETLRPLVTDVIEEDHEDIEIETGTGQRIRLGKLVLKKPVLVVADGKTVHYNDAWESMREFLGELRTRGALEE